MTGQFVVTRNGRDTFHDEASLRTLADGGGLSPGDLVFHPTLGRWLYARDVAELRAPLARSLVVAGSRALDGSERVPNLRDNSHAIAGFVLALLGQVPVLGVLSCVLGIYFSARGLQRAGTLGSGQGLAIAGLVVSIALLVPAAACAAIVFAVL